MQSSGAEKADALTGIRVLDFTMVMSGPFATRLLADLGAEVLKVETLDGDQVRARPPLVDGQSRYFGHLNAGKRSIAVDLKSPKILPLIKAIAATSDVLVENFRPGVMKRLGLDFDTLAAENQRLIYCSISGYGQHGPLAGAPAYAPVIHAASGFDLVNLQYQDRAERPANSGIFVADVLGGTHAFGAIQTALFQRERTGVGQYIDVSMLESMLGMLVFETQQAQNPAPRRPVYSPLKTLDGFIMIAPTSSKNFGQLTDAVGHPEWRDDRRFRTDVDRNANWTALLAAIEEWTITQTSLQAERWLIERGIPCSRYRRVEELLEDAQIAAREFFTTISDSGGSYRVPNPPFQMSGARAEARQYVARLGEDGPAILRDLGVSDAEIAGLRNQRLLG